MTTILWSIGSLVTAALLIASLLWLRRHFARKEAERRKSIAYIESIFVQPKKRLAESPKTHKFRINK